jgi:hypothetical protein
MAGATRPFADTAFDPDAVHVMTAAFDDAWQSLPSAGVKFESDQADAVRGLLAKCIIEAARAGERDRGRLRDAGLASLAEAWRRS